MTMLLVLYLSALATSHNSKRKVEPPENCYEQDIECIKEKLNYDAIALIHSQIDEDHDGSVEPNESREFFEEELNMSSSDNRSMAFHGEDQQISVSEFWSFWQSSEAHNWSEALTQKWLIEHVKMPKYISVFRRFRVSGRDIPRLAANASFKSKVLGIVDPIDRKRIQLMALDVILFGCPLNSSHFLKDCLMVASLSVALLGILVASRQNSKFHKERSLVRELNEKIEQNLKELEYFPYIKETESEEDLLSYSKIEITSSTRFQLESLLTQTYEVEYSYVRLVKRQIDEQVLYIKDQVEKMNRKRTNSAFSAIKYGYFNSFSEIDTKMINARKSAEEFNVLFKDFKLRWKGIRELCGINIAAKESVDFRSFDVIPSNGNGQDKSEDIQSSNVGGSLEDITVKPQKFGIFKKRKKA